MIALRAVLVCLLVSATSLGCQSSEGDDESTASADALSLGDMLGNWTGASTELEASRSVTSSLHSTASVQQFSFRGTKGATVSLRVHTDGFTPRILFGGTQLRGPDGFPLREAKGSEGSSSVEQRLTIPADTVYFLKVGSADQDGGTFVIAYEVT